MKKLEEAEAKLVVESRIIESNPFEVAKEVEKGLISPSYESPDKAPSESVPQM